MVMLVKAWRVEIALEQEGVEAVAAEPLLELGEEEGPLFVRDLGHPVVGVAAGQVDVEDRDPGAWEPVQVVPQFLDAEHGLDLRAFGPRRRSSTIRRSR